MTLFETAILIILSLIVFCIYLLTKTLNIIGERITNLHDFLMKIKELK